MAYDPKFKINQPVYVFADNFHKIYEGIVIEIKIKRHSTMTQHGIGYNTIFEYVVQSDKNEFSTKVLSECRVFSSKKEAAYSWLDNQGLTPSDVVQGYFESKKME